MTLKRLLIGLLLACAACHSVNAQTVNATKLLLNTFPFLYGTKDTTFAAATYDQIPAAKAVKIYADRHLGGRNLLTTAPTTGQVIRWNGTAWEPYTISGGGSVSKTYEEFDGLSGTTITSANPFPSSEREWRVNLYRDGLRLRYTKDFTISGSAITLLVSASSENFTLIIE
jgi:hypothetical protein